MRRDAVGVGTELQSGYAGNQLDARPISHLVDDLTTLVGWAKHHHPAQFRDRFLAKGVTQQDATERMRYEMDPGSACLPALIQAFANDHWCQDLDGLGGRWIIHICRRKALLLQRLGKPVHGSPAAIQAVQQDHAFRTLMAFNQVRAHCGRAARQ